MTKPKSQAQRIGERVKFLTEVDRFVVSLINARGKELERRESASNIRVVSELRDFSGFSFFTTRSWSDSMKVIYHNPSGPRVVLDFTYTQEIKADAVIRIFATDPDWQHTLLRTLRNWRRIAKKIDSVAERSFKTKEALSRRGETEAELEERAQRLAIR